MKDLVENKNELTPINEEELPSVTSVENLIEEVHKSAVINEVRTNKEIQGKFVNQARKSVGDVLHSIDQNIAAKKQKSTFDANKEACLMYGIDEQVPSWQIILMKFGYSLWFIVYFIFATITIVPINIFFKGISTFIKNNIIVFIMAVLCYLTIVIGIPLLISLV